MKGMVNMAFFPVIIILLTSAGILTAIVDEAEKEYSHEILI